MNAPAPRWALLPAATGGLVLLVLGALTLLAGGSLALGNPASLDLWLLGVGLLVLLGAILLTVVRAPAPTTRTAPRPIPPGPPARRTSPAPRKGGQPAARGPLAPAGRTGGVAIAATPPRPATRTERPLPPSSTIAAQYAALVPPPSAWAAAVDAPPWDEEDLVSLPFSAGPRLSGAVGLGLDPPSDGSPFPSVGYLEREVVRLRDRIRELEGQETSRWVPVEPTIPIRTASPDGTPPTEPPRPVFDGPRRACTGCGSGLLGGATDPLCWGCGRPLCATCYWRTKEGTGAHTCPACFARTAGPGISGARGSSQAPTGAPTASSKTMATPRR